MKKKIVFTVFVGLMSVFCFFNTAHADATTVHLDIETSTGPLYNHDITVTPCNSDNGATGNSTISAYCAVLQSGLPNTWTWFGTDAFLDSVGGVANDTTNNTYWGWFGNLTYGATSLSAHILTPGENILLNYNINPLQLTVSNTNPSQNDTVTLTLTQFGLDSNYNPIWTPATSGSIVVNGTPYAVASDGTYKLTLNSATPYIISGNETGFINSNTITLNPIPAPVASGGGQLSSTSTPAVTDTSTPTAPVTAPVVTSPAPITPTFDTGKAFDFLTAQQGTDGSFDGDLYTDWTATALASGNYEGQTIKLIKYFEQSNLQNPNLTDYERRAIALMSLGLNPYDTNGVNYIGKIVTSFDGKQFGDPSQDNDDIFALVVLQNAGYTQNDSIISNDINFILSTQNTDGSWDSNVDMTGAAMEALSAFNQTGAVKTALGKAETYLEQSQKTDGSWNDNASSTAWAIEGILAQNEKPEDWSIKAADGTAGKTPLDYLATIQDTDGGVKDTDIQNKIWETAYVTSALSLKTWNQLMQTFTKQDLTTLPETPAIPTETPVNTNTVSVKDVPKKEIAAIKSENPAIANTASVLDAINYTPATPAPVIKQNWLINLLEKIF
jgi:hypothetical protein